MSSRFGIEDFDQRVMDHPEIDFTGDSRAYITTNGTTFAAGSGTVLQYLHGADEETRPPEEPESITIPMDVEVPEGGPRPLHVLALAFVLFAVLSWVTRGLLTLDTLAADRRESTAFCRSRTRKRRFGSVPGVG